MSQNSQFVAEGKERGNPFMLLLLLLNANKITLCDTELKKEQNSHVHSCEQTFAPIRPGPKSKDCHPLGSHLLLELRQTVIHCRQTTKCFPQITSLQ